MKCILEKTPLKHKSIRLVPRNSRGKELLERMRRQNKKWGNGHFSVQQRLQKRALFGSPRNARRFYDVQLYF